MGNSQKTQNVNREDQCIDANSNLEDQIAAYKAVALKEAESEQTWLNHCKLLTSEYRKLLKQSKSKSELYNKESNVVYLMQNKWIHKWKKMHYYDYFNRDLVPKFEEFREKEI